MRSRLRRLVVPVAVVASFVLAGCQQKDTTPPPAPRVDPITSPTMLPTQALSGTAEYGSTVKLTRNPAFTAAENKMGPFTMEADPFTAKWRFVVPLAVGQENVFTITATDAAGNVSKPTTVKIKAEAPQAQHLMLTLGSPVVDADTGTLHASVKATADEAGVDLSGLEITFAAKFTTGGPSGGVSPVKATTDQNGVATADISGLTTAGTGTLTATATLGGATASSDFVIRGGAPATLNLQLGATVGGNAVGPGTDIKVPAATAVTATVTVTDGSNNPVNVPFSLYTNAPGAIIEGNTLTGITKAGTWTVVATVTGAGAQAGMQVSNTATLEVQPGPVTAIDLTLGSATVTAGEPVKVSAVPVDTYGNPVLGQTPTITSSDTTAVFANGTVTHDASGAKTITASLAGTGTTPITATAPLQVMPGPTAVVSLQLSQSTVTPGTVVSYTVVHQDAYGNTTPDLIRLQTDAPAAVIAGGKIQNLTKTGSYTVWAASTTTGVSDAEPLTVTTGSATTLTLTLGATVVRTGQPLTYQYKITDAYGNTVNTPVTITTTDAGATITTATQSIVFATPGLQQVTATAGALTDTDPVLVQPQPDIVPPTVTISSPTSGAVWVSGQNMPVTVTATDGVSLSSIRLQIRGSFNYDNLILVTTNPPTTSDTVTFNVPIPGNQWGSASIVAEAADGAGNVTVSPATPITVTPATINTGNGGTATPIAGGANSGIRRPMGMTLDASGHLFVACSGGNGNPRGIMQVDLNPGANYAVSQYGVSVPSRMADLAWDPASGNIYLSTGRDWNGGGGAMGLMSMSPGGSLSQFSVTNNEMTGLYLEGTGTLLAGNWNANQIESYNTAGTPPLNPSGTTNFGGQVNQPWGIAYAQTTVNGHVNSVTYVANQGSNRIAVAHTVNGVTTTSNINTGGLMAQPTAMVMLSNGNLLVADTGNGDLVEINTATCDPQPWTAPPTNCQGSIVASGFARPTGLAYDPAGNLYVSDFELNAIFKLTGF